MTNRSALGPACGCLPAFRGWAVRLLMRYAFLDDVSSPNDTLRVAVPKLHLSAAVWTIPVERSISDAQRDCLSYALGILSANWPDWGLWLIAGHRAVQPENRITRHNGLWKSLRKAGVLVPDGDSVGESLLESDGGIRVFGAVRFDLNQVQAAHSVMTSEQAAIILMPERRTKDAISSIVRNGWAAEILNTKPPEEILEAVCAHEGLVVDFYGRFDDPAVSVAAIGKRAVLADLLLDE